MIYYIHGYNGFDGSTSKLMEKELGAICLTYDVNEPIKSVKKIEDELLKSDDHPIIIASSLGAWFAEMINLPKDLILYNPSIDPKSSLKKYGFADDICNKYVEISGSNDKRVVNLSDDDEVLDHNVALDYYLKKGKIVITSGGHKMTPDNFKIIKGETKYLTCQL